MAVEHGPLSYYTFETPQVFRNFVGQLKFSLRSKETQLIERLSCGFRTICHLTLRQEWSVVISINLMMGGATLYSQTMIITGLKILLGLLIMQ